jgi:membrane associated rhomboid family serine protease
MIPLRDKNPTRTFPLFTALLIAANVIVFFTEPLTATQAAQVKFFFCKAAIPWEVIHGSQLPQVAQELGCHKNVWFSIFYSMFLHGGWLHIAGNMLFLWIFGNNIEDRLGPVKYLILYFASGIAAAYAQSLVAVAGSPSGVLPAISSSAAQPMVGASGAIAGGLGAYLVMFPRARVTTLVIFFFIAVVDIPAVVLLGFWFLLQVFSGVASVGATASTGVAFFAHVGGFIAGMVLLTVLRPRRAPSEPFGPDVPPGFAV